MRQLIRSILLLGSAQLVTLEKWSWPSDTDGRIYPDSLADASDVAPRYADNEAFAQNLVGSRRDCSCLHPRFCHKPSVILSGSCGIGKAYCCGNGLQDAQLFVGQNRLNEFGGQRNEKLLQRPFNNDVLVGPEGFTGNIGPPRQQNYKNQDILVGPGGPTGIIGPNHQNNIKQDILVGPGGPTGIGGPNQNQYIGSDNRPGKFSGSNSYSQNVLVGPGGPNGLIGPNYNQQLSRRPKQGVLVGPGGPTGIIGPAYNRYNSQRGILVGPGGPTGQIGPKYGLLGSRYNNRQSYY